MLTGEMAEEIVETIEFRQSHFSGETLRTSTMVVLLNYGDRLTEVECISGDWNGTKADVNVSPRGLPICPLDGRPLLEVKHWRLGLMEESRP